MPTINVSNIYPGNYPHIKQVIREKHKGKIVTFLYRVGSEVVYTVNNKI